jgi:hypothetical protein
MVLPLGMRGVVRRTSRPTKVLGLQSWFKPWDDGVLRLWVLEAIRQTMQFNPDLKEVS